MEPAKCIVALIVSTRLADSKRPVLLASDGLFESSWSTRDARLVGYHRGQMVEPVILEQKAEP